MISEFMQTALANPGLISLAAGFVDQASLPREAVARITAEIFADPVQGRKALQYGTTNGDPTLRREIIGLLERNERVDAGTFAAIYPRVVVTTGSAQLLYLIAEALLDPGDIVLVEAPTYFVFLGVLETRGARVIGIPIDDGGMRLDALETTLADLEVQGDLGRVKMIYTVSEHSNPLLTMYRRKRDVMLAALDEHFGPFEGAFTWTRPRGGMFVWLEAPSHLDLGTKGPVVPCCLERGVLYIPGGVAFPDEPIEAPRHFARICFGVPSEADLVEGVRRLAAAFEECSPLLHVA